MLLAIFNPFFGTLNKVWPLNPTASRLGRPLVLVKLNLVFSVVMWTLNSQPTGTFWPGSLYDD